MSTSIKKTPKERSYNRRFEFKLAMPIPKNIPVNIPNNIPNHVMLFLSEQFSELVNDSLSKQEVLNRLYWCRHWTNWVIRDYEACIALDTPFETESFDD